MKFEYPEGATPLDAESQHALIPSLTTQAELNEFEQVNIGNAVTWAAKNKRLKSTLLTIEGLKFLHKKMFDRTWKWAGKFRTSDTNIGTTWSDIPAELKTLCDDTRYWVENGTYPWDELAARFHHRLVAIHPFPNGNGRHARLAANLLLNHNGKKQFSWGVKSITAEGEVRTGYLKALREADLGNIKPLIEFARS